MTSDHGVPIEVRHRRVRFGDRHFDIVIKESHTAPTGEATDHKCEIPSLAQVRHCRRAGKCVARGLKVEQGMVGERVGCHGQVVHLTQTEIPVYVVRLFSIAANDDQSFADTVREADRTVEYLASRHGGHKDRLERLGPSQRRFDLDRWKSRKPVRPVGLQPRNGKFAGP